MIASFRSVPELSLAPESLRSPSSYSANARAGAVWRTIAAILLSARNTRY